MEIISYRLFCPHTIRTYLAHQGCRSKVCKRSLYWSCCWGRDLAEKTAEVKTEHEPDLPDQKTRAITKENMLHCMLKLLEFCLLDFWSHLCERDKCVLTMMWHSNWANLLRICTFKRRIHGIKAQWATVVTVSLGSSKTRSKSAKSLYEEIQSKEDDWRSLRKTECTKTSYSTWLSKSSTYKALTRSLNSLPATIPNNEQMINLEWFARHSLHF